MTRIQARTQESRYDVQRSIDSEAQSSMFDIREARRMGFFCLMIEIWVQQLAQLRIERGLQEIGSPLCLRRRNCEQGENGDGE
jgi:hypothetical protein